MYSEIDSCDKSFHVNSFERRNIALRLAAFSRFYMVWYGIPGILYHILYHAASASQRFTPFPTPRSAAAVVLGRACVQKVLVWLGLLADFRLYALPQGRTASRSPPCSRAVKGIAASRPPAFHFFPLSLWHEHHRQIQRKRETALSTISPFRYG